MWVSIDPRRLKIGHFVRIEHGWLSHPFPRNTFTITSQHDIDLILENNLKRLSIDPGRSTIADDNTQRIAVPALAPGDLDAAPGVVPAADAVDATAAPVGAVVTGAAAAPATAFADTAAATAAPTAQGTAQLKRRLVQAASERRQRLRSLSGEFVEDARQCAQAVRMIEAGEPAGYSLLEGMAGNAVSHSAAEGSTLCYAGTALTPAAIDADAAAAVAAMSLAAELGRRVGLEHQLWCATVVAAALRAIGLRRLPLVERIRPTVGVTVPPGQLRNYPQLGADILARVGCVPEAVVQRVAQHRECLDGSGFPHGLRGRDIAAGALLVGVIHEFQELTAPGRSPHSLSPSEAVSHLYRTRREQFGTDVLNHFVATLGVYPPGTFVLLSDDSLAVVVRVNPSQRLRPTVLMLDHRESLMDGDVTDLSVTDDLSIVRTMTGDKLPPLAVAFAGIGDTAGLKIDRALLESAQA